MNLDPASTRIRRMTAADLGQVMELAAKVPEAPHWPEPAYRMALDSGSNVRRVALVADDGPLAGIFGFAIASLLPPQAELETVAVAPEHWRQGTGRRLFDALATELRAQNASVVRLEVRVSNHAAIAFYRSLGFVRAGLRSRYYADPIEDALQMKLRLA